MAAVLSINVFSVWHTGWRFTRDLLRRSGLEENWVKNKPNYNHVHFNLENRKIFQGDGKTIIPLRKKPAVQESWQRRGLSLEKLDMVWEEMKHYVANHENVWLFRIDDPRRREGDLERIRELLGVSVKVDFNNKIGHYSNLYKGTNPHVSSS